MKKIRMLLADDHKIVRHGLVSTLEADPRLKIAAQAGSGLEAVRLARKHCPDIVLMDISMPDLNGMEASRQILCQNPDIKIIALSMHAEKVYVMGMLDAGVSGYLLKSCSFNELKEAIDIVLEGKIYLSHEVTSLVVESAVATGHEKKASRYSLLSKREREVLQLISEGHSNKKIGVKLNISIKTVQIHRTNLKKKLNLFTTAALTKYAVAKGLTSILPDRDTAFPEDYKY
ncbi:response regulator [Desulfospira joergensenii]|uniref:response regulator n=1 Tax=Desulfospira joergensenii TaxID=53329 RepID=UPI0003B46118|nr:response regulator transcription factor [Desulfospira joergensenii]